MTTVTCTAESLSCSFAVTVNDAQPPVIGPCPANIVANTGNTSGTVVVNYPTPPATDNCGVVSVVCSPPSGSQFTPGTTTVTCTASDAAQNHASCSFTVTVFDTCLQDDSTGDFLQWNSTTGDYLFTHCGSQGFMLAGKGTVSFVNNIRYLSDSKPDRRITAGLNMAQLTGRANITLIPAPGIYQTFVVNQTNPRPKCACS